MLVETSLPMSVSCHNYQHLRTEKKNVTQLLEISTIRQLKNKIINFILDQNGFKQQPGTYTDILAMNQNRL